jgi:hypothetical protein
LCTESSEDAFPLLHTHAISGGGPYLTFWQDEQFFLTFWRPTHTLSHKSVLEVLKLSRKEDPVKPSRRLSSSGDRAVEITQQRRTDSGSLNRILIGDLDGIGRYRESPV